MATIETVRRHAEMLLKSIGVSRIVVVDDEYSGHRPEVEDLLGFCTALQPERVAGLPYLDGIDFEADREIWADRVREKWRDLDDTKREEVLERARSATAEVRGETDVPAPGGGAELAVEVDTRAAKSLEELLEGLETCIFITLSLSAWRARAGELLADEMAATTVFLFDRNFGREQEGAENEGLNLIREVQGKEVGYCGLISHTIQRGGEYDAWHQLAEDHSLVRDKFVVIAKERLTADSPDHYSFLRMLRLVALSGRCADVKSRAWAVFERSVTEAQAAMERLSPMDFDQIVLTSSRREGVWEPDTLLRVFGILMRQEARARLYEDTDIPTAIAEARRISAIPEEVAAPLGEEKPSREALRIQRFETYESDDALSRFCLPIELGDIFERPSTGRRYILLTQPCDLMVRKDGKRSCDDKYRRCGSLVELVLGSTEKETKESWKELPFFDQGTGAPAYADLARAFHVQLAVLDICAFRQDGIAAIEMGASCPELLIEPWKQRYRRLQQYFGAALGRYQELERRKVENGLKLLVLPSAAGGFPVTVSGKTLQYDLRRVMRLRQPRSGALLTAFAQHQARAAFEHPFEHRVPMEEETNGDHEPDEDGGPLQ